MKKKNRKLNEFKKDSKKECIKCGGFIENSDYMICESCRARNYEIDKRIRDEIRYGY